MKKYQKYLLGIGGFLAIGTLVGGPIVASVVTQNNSNSNIYVPPSDNHSSSNVQFTDNIQEFQRIFNDKKPTLTVFNDPKNPDSPIKPWSKLPTIASAPDYQSIYNQININHITTDVLSFLTKVVNKQNQDLKFKILNFGGDINFNDYIANIISPTPSNDTKNYQDKVFQFTINFEVYNPFNVNKIFYLNDASGAKNQIFLNQHQISHQSIMVNSSINPEFTAIANSDGTSNYYINYYLTNVK